MRAFLLLAITLICSSTSLAGDSEAKSNIEIIIVLSEISGSCVLGEGKTDVDCPCLTALLIV